jgi:hypothetical protein
MIQLRSSSISLQAQTNELVMRRRFEMPADDTAAQFINFLAGASD